jgi:hypothetical protein
VFLTFLSSVVASSPALLRLPLLRKGGEEAKPALLRLRRRGEGLAEVPQSGTRAEHGPVQLTRRVLDAKAFAVHPSVPPAGEKLQDLGG